MSKVIVRGGLPGFMRVELEGGEGVDIRTDLNAYQAAHELQPFMQTLADSVPEQVEPARKSKAPPKGDA